MNYTDEQIILSGKIKIHNFLKDIGIEKLRNQIIAGLKAPQKSISSKFFYDDLGSKLFEEITRLDEYYPTRTEKKILSLFIPKANIDFHQLSIIELGSGDSSKIKLLLKQIPQHQLSSIRYIPVDISQSAIVHSTESIVNEFDLYSINGIVADFVHQLNILPKRGRRLFCFFGSTIGNFTKKERSKFISDLAHEMNVGDGFLLGMDKIKDIIVLENAYNDKKGVTAAFNKNILNVVNKLCFGNFNPDNFEHIAFYNPLENRIEMHLKALKDIDVLLMNGAENIHFSKGEMIHTENSHKFDNRDIKTIEASGNFFIKNIFSDDKEWFNLIYFVKK